jgi:hypothetical protein
MNYKTLEFEVSDQIATITLSRPDAANSLNQQMGDELLMVPSSSLRQARCSVPAETSPDSRIQRTPENYFAGSPRACTRLSSAFSAWMHRWLWR